MPKQHPRTRFGKAALAATKWCKTTQNMSFGPNVVDWMCFGRETRKKFGWPGLVPKRHPRNRLRNGALAANKWCETTQNVSFGRKVVDWMRFGQKNSTIVRSAQTRAKMASQDPISPSGTCCYQMVRNHPKHEFRT